LASSDVTRVLAQLAGDPDERSGEGEPWQAVVQARDGRCMVVRGYPDEANAYTQSLVGDSVPDLVDQFMHIIQTSSTGRLILATAPLLIDMPGVSPDVCHRWAQSGDSELQWAAAGSNRLTRQDWHTLVLGPPGAARARALRNPVADPEALERLATMWESKGGAEAEHWLHCLASNPACPQPVLSKLLQHPSHHVRQGVLSNPNCPEEYRALARVTR
jgi:hypothetical protein